MKYLIIPHYQVDGYLRSRPTELAKALVGRGDEVHVLRWQEPSNKIDKIKSEFYVNSNVRHKSVTKIGFEEVHVQPSFIPVVKIYRNRKMLDKLMKDEGYDFIINCNTHHFSVSEKYSSQYIYDVLDDHFSNDNNRKNWKKTRKFVVREVVSCSSVITISHELAKIIRDLTSKEAIYIPNGVYYDEYANALKDSDKNYSGIKTITYIGSHGWHSNLNFSIRVFKKVHDELHGNVIFKIVGPVNEKITESISGYNIELVGSVSPNDVVDYFINSDLGVLPFSKSPFTDNALPLKLLEYGASKVKVVSSDLNELKNIKLPHVDLVPLDEDLWVEALIKALKNDKWKDEWDATIKEYDWNQIVKNLKC
ncbi:glycosyltransferase family 4 protein [Vibrio cyclitrophicus]|uniref:glycosyltransferase family 4 protein n=1 Tax=Vibrio cyclitrophicus TaxID=47951 RepID=UPI0002E3FA52|nr:glycosyltransferase family 4 protein [Vibrio cyclitrophicus]OEF43716.1 hypothetical protein OAC_09765 [Vibrio cyclitrophicus 1F273]